jgi:hypothetical protein
MCRQFLATISLQIQGDSEISLKKNRVIGDDEKKS